jgi:hypothetical protein
MGLTKTQVYIAMLMLVKKESQIFNKTAQK